MMFTGTNQQQDTRFSDKEKKLLKQMKFGDCLNRRVDMSKVKLDVLRPWISKKITDILHIEDDVVVEFVYNQLEEEKYPCPKKMQINMTGFLNGKNARQFMGELWALLLSAQESASGIPAEFIKQKKEEILKREEEQRDRRSSCTLDSLGKGSKDGIGGLRDVRNSPSQDRSFPMDMPAGTRSAIEHVRSQLSAKANANMAVDNNSGNIVSKTGDVPKSKLPRSKNEASAYSKRETSRSRERKKSREYSQHRFSSRDHDTASRPRNRSRDREKRQFSRSSKRNHSPKFSRSPMRRNSCSSNRRTSRSLDKKARRSRSAENKLLNQKINRRSRSHGISSKKRSQKSEKRSQSRTIEKNVLASRTNELRKTRHASTSLKQQVNGVNFDKTQTIEKKLMKSSLRKKSRCRSTRSSSKSRGTNRSRITRSLKNQVKSRRSDSATSWRSTKSKHQHKLSGSPESHSHNSSLFACPDGEKNDFDLKKKINSIQRKRQYRKNRFSSSGSSSDRLRLDAKKREGQQRHSSRADSSFLICNPRSRSRRRSTSNTISPSLRVRIRSRSRSPRRRRWSSNFQFRGGRGVVNRGRFTNFRRSSSRGRGIGSSRRFSPLQHRYSRERRSSPNHHQYRDRKFSPPYRKFSPKRMHRHSRERMKGNSRDRQRDKSRDRRNSSPIREKRASAHREHRRTSPLTHDVDQSRKRKDQKSGECRPVILRSTSSTSSNWEVEEEAVSVSKTDFCSEKGTLFRSAKRVSRRCYSKESSSGLDVSVRRPSPKASNESQITDHASGENASVSIELKKIHEEEREPKKGTKSLVTSDAVLVKKISHATDNAYAVCSKETLEQKFPNERKQFPRIIASLSRTPSPFLKPHERKNTQVILASAPIFQRKLLEATYSRTDKSNNASSSSTSGSSTETEISQEKCTKDVTTKLLKRKHNDSSNSENSSESSGNVSGRNSDSNERLSFNKKNSLVKVSEVEDVIQKSKSSEECKEKPELYKNKVFKFAGAFTDETKNKTVVIENTEVLFEKVYKHKISNKMRSKYTQSVNSLKTSQTNDSSDSAPSLKRRRKQSKKTSKKDSDTDISDSDSDSKKKKQKKHKKHNKKNKKHKKHKKNNRKAYNTSSSENEMNANTVGIAKKTLRTCGVNEDLEKKLREKALKSMKKMD